MTHKVTPQLKKAREDLAETTRKIELREDVRRSLDATEQALADGLQQTVNKRQHGLATHEDVEAARQKLEEFTQNRWQREKSILDKIDESSNETS